MEQVLIENTLLLPGSHANLERKFHDFSRTKLDFPLFSTSVGSSQENV